MPYAQNRDGRANVFSHNLIAAVVGRTGGTPVVVPPSITTDYARFRPEQRAPALPPADAGQHVGGTTVGPAYWALARSFPRARFVVQLPMAVRSVAEAVAWATSAADVLGVDRILAFELGNEADLYPAPGLGPPVFQGQMSNASYVANFTAYTAVATVVELPDRPFFQAFDTSVHLDDPAKDAYALHIPTCFRLGINSGSVVQAVAMHFYQTVSGSADLAAGLMNHRAIARRLDLMRPAMAFLAREHPGIPFVLSEVGNSLGRPRYAYQTTLGSALWQVDVQLYALAMGIARIHMQQILDAGFSLWQPVATPALERQVLANFYAQPFVADLVGRSRTTQLAQLAVSGAGDNVVAYGAFVDGEMARAAVNLDYWSAARSRRPRRSTAIRVEVPGCVRSVVVERLASPGGASGQAGSMTYAGSQWTYESLGREVKHIVNDTQTLPVSGGAIAVAVPESEAVMLHFGREAGAGARDGASTMMGMSAIVMNQEWEEQTGIGNDVC